MKHCIFQDSSFLIATLSQSDVFHTDAVYVFKKIIENKKDVRIIVPSLVFYETIVTLYKKGMPRKQIEEKLWNFLYSDMVLNVAQLETAAFKTCKRLSQGNLSDLRTQDFIIHSIALEYEAQILTFDKKVRETIGNFYKQIYYCSNIGNGSVDETPEFLKDLYTALGKGPIENFEQIPF